MTPPAPNLGSLGAFAGAPLTGFARDGINGFRGRGARANRGKVRSPAMRHGPPRLGSGLRIAWNLLLVVGLILFNGVDYDGDPTTSNGPPVVLTAGIGASYREEEEAQLPLPSAASPCHARKRLWRRARCWQRRARAIWYRRIRPIRGP